MKLTKENIYINLQGKSEEELTEINNILDDLKQVKRRDNIIEYFNEPYDCFNYLHFYNDEWVADTDFFYLKTKREVTIEQLKEILQPMEMINLMGYSVEVDNEEQARKLQELAIEQGFEWKYGGKVLKNLDERYFLFGYGGEKVIICSSSHYQDKHITKKAHFNDLFKEETLQEKEQRLLKELEDVRKEIEDSKIKVGDWVMNKEGVVMKVKSLPLIMPWEKITNPKLIELLEQEIK